jgi:hypothetical protein
VSAGYGELQPELKGQLESKIEGVLSGKISVTGVSVWQPKSVANYSHFVITNIEPHGHGYEATAQVHFPDKVENLYLRTDNSAEEITELSLGFRLPGTAPDDPQGTEPVDPPRRTPKPGPAGPKF